MHKHNFSAGPSILPQEVMKKASEVCIDFDGMGLSLLEISHRSKEFEAVIAEAISLIKELLGLSDDFEIIFETGGASSQFFMVPMNLLDQNATAGYVNTGTWATNAIKEARAYGNVNVLASSEESKFSYIPKNYEIPSDLSYLHITSNNTIYGTQYHFWPETEVPMVCDMSSDIFSRPFDPEKFGLIYAGAQKNLGPAGVTLVIIRKDMLGKVNRQIPTMLDYRTHIKGGSMYNTPPVFPIYVCMLTLRWIKQMGGVSAMEARNRAKAETFYSELDRNPMFKGTVEKEDRSWMNANFVMQNPDLEESFTKKLKEAGIIGLKGHRSVGGFRASMYNALPLESVQALTKVMSEFAEENA